MHFPRLLLTSSRGIHSAVKTAMALRFDGRVALVTGAGGGESGARSLAGMAWAQREELSRDET